MFSQRFLLSCRGYLWTSNTQNRCQLSITMVNFTLAMLNFTLAIRFNTTIPMLYSNAQRVMASICLARYSPLAAITMTILDIAHLLVFQVMYSVCPFCHDVALHGPYHGMCYGPYRVNWHDMPAIHNTIGYCITCFACCVIGFMCLY